MSNTPPDLDPISPEEEQKLEADLDELMDPRGPDGTSESTKKRKAKDADAGSDLPPIDIFSDPKTAPDVPEEVRKTMKFDDKSEGEHKIDVKKKVSSVAAEPAPSTDEPAEDEKLLPAEATPDKPDDKSPLDDAETDEAVDDITAEESDKVLEAEDEEIQKAFAPKRSFIQRLKDGLTAWWGNKKARWGTIGGVVIILAVLAFLPGPRSFALNLVGVRATATLTVLDDTTSLPLKNATVQLSGQTAQTNSDGNATLHHVKLGSQTLTVKKVAFATDTEKVNIGMGSNRLNQVSLKAVGTQYHFNIVDYVSQQPVTTAEAVSGEANAEADKKGQIILTANNPDKAALGVTITADGYRSETVSVPVGSTATTTVQLVSSRPDVFVSNQSGKYELYKEDIDGKNKELLLAGTGNETSRISVVVNADGSEAALVSTRDNVRDSGGYLEQALTIVNVSDGSDLTIDHSDLIQIIDWVGNRIVYVIVKPGASAGNPQRYQLISYDYQTKQRLMLAHANYFNDVVSAGGVIYYATSNNYSGGVSQFEQVNPDGTGAKVLLTDEVWNIFRTGYSSFVLQSSSNWYTYKLGDSKPVATTTTTANKTRLYVDNPDGKHSIWTDTRDGKGALVVYDTAKQKDTVLTEQSGLTYPVRWLDNNTIIYRVSTSSETADYVVSLSGGSPKKITDVNNAAGLTPWYYY